MKRHEDIDRRRLLLHRLVSGKFLRDPALLERPRAAMARWRSAEPETPAMKEWKQLLDALEAGEIVALLRSLSQRAARLRQSSPFVGILSERERMRVLKRDATASA